MDYSALCRNAKFLLQLRFSDAIFLTSIKYRPGLSRLFRKFPVKLIPWIHYKSVIINAVF